jgi:hypothetical protein
MRCLLGLALAGLAVVGTAPGAAAQESAFGIRGLGFLGRPISARSAGTGGGYALFDASSAVSPASLAAWSGAVGWATGAGSSRTLDTGTGPVSLQSTRFPVFGFAAPVGARLVVGISASDYLNRNWSVTQTDTVTPRGPPVAVTDQTKSLGGVTDIRVAAAYRVSGQVAVGLGLHALTGSAETVVVRDFPADTSYRPFVQNSVTDFSAVAVSVGVFVTPRPRLILGASARLNGRLKAETPGDTARVHLPVELNAGVYYAPVEGVSVSSTFGYATWSAAASDLVAAGQLRSTNIWNAALGVEAALLRLGRQAVPLRAGYRWRQLPFPIPQPSPAGARGLIEQALTGGFGFSAAGGHANVDVAIEVGSRSAGVLSEHFTTALVGVSILP